MNYFSTVISLLRDRKEFLAEIYDGVGLKTKMAALLISSSCFFAIYGAIIGSYHSLPQVASSAIKLPALYLITLVICLPTLYIFNALFGSKQTIGQHFTYLLTAVSVIAILLCGFAPVTLFFLITVNDYSFFLLLNVAIFALTGIIGVTFLYQIMKPISDNDGDQGAKVRKNILRFWLVLYGFVGSQLGWTLRPFLGSQGQFELFRPREGSFFSGVWNALVSLFS
ncbi:hypothetical protein H6F86_22835 [Phormidium sp. FACHB-592]|uniref:Actin-binding WH2 domain-containing protein n=1 Tax=Stenomitos frigidus AS-A4 TaxID=2933935 RepID=A0ABV0KFR3_9CYAN|nr:MULTISPECIES: hypothetical protein [Cyanophyceae]MBD2038894.1 hypothetical protein [Leptolyngbya sp. FACHB-321]MBD2076670.1 hypothetical protein [Phormidium sp. FACHB-592]